MAASAVGVSDLLESAFTSTLQSTVVTYDQYQKEKEKKDQIYFEPLNIDQLFNSCCITNYSCSAYSQYITCVYNRSF